MYNYYAKLPRDLTCQETITSNESLEFSKVIFGVIVPISNHKIIVRTTYETVIVNTCPPLPPCIHPILHDLFTIPKNVVCNPGRRRIKLIFCKDLPSSLYL